MDELTVFHFKNKKTPIHALNTLCKIVITFEISIIIFFSIIYGLSAITLFLLLLTIIARINIFTLLKQLKVFLIILIFIFLSYSINTEGNIVLKFYFINISKQGLINGALHSWKFFLIIITGLILTDTTNPSSFQSAVFSLLKYFPYINHRKIASVSGMTFSILPKILDTFKNTEISLKSRNFQNRKGIFSKIKYRILPLTIKTILMSGNFTDSYLSRNYNENIILKNNICLKDIIKLIITSILLLSIFIIDFIFLR